MKDDPTLNSSRNAAAHLRLVLWRANKAVERAEHAHLQSLGLCLTDFAILEALLHKGALPVNAVGEKVLLTSGSITTAIQRLEEKGWVRREKSVQDRRVVSVGLTETGRELIELLWGKHVARLEEVMAVLTGEEQERMTEALKKLGLHASLLG